MYSIIVNPVSNKFVSINSKDGKTILKKYLKMSQYGGHDSHCALNPTTGRCKQSDYPDGNCENVNGRCRAIKLGASSRSSSIKKSTPSSRSSAKPVSSSKSAVSTGDLNSMNLKELKEYAAALQPPVIPTGHKGKKITWINAIEASHGGESLMEVTSPSPIVRKKEERRPKVIEMDVITPSPVRKTSHKAVLPQGFSGGNFHDVREELIGKRQYYQGRIRGESIKYVAENPGEVGGKYHDEFEEDISESRKKALRQSLQKRFNIIPFNFLEWNGLDQGSEGACSFVGFLNMTLITGNRNNIKPKSATTQSGWGRKWFSMVRAGDIDGDEGAADIAQTLDGMVNAEMLNSSNIVYIPIRSAGGAERFFNTDFWINKDNLKKYEPESGTDKWEQYYDQTPWMYQNANMVESLIDLGKPIEINCMGHSRTCIGYNDNELIFADNWGSNSILIPESRTEFDSEQESAFAVGYSTINKWAIYSWMRDAVYWK